MDDGRLSLEPAGEAEARTIRLLDLRPGECAHVADVDGPGAEGDILLHLSRYGLLPGTPVRLARKRPVPIVQVGQTDLAIDHAIAARIYVDVS
jgi:Fe2+ transport system protein FeoA